MIFKELTVYKWKDFFKEPVFEEGIMELLGDDLFRLVYDSNTYKFTCPGSGISKAVFIKKGKIEYAGENKKYQILEGEFMLMPRGRYLATYADMGEYFTAILTKDLPYEIIRREREKFPKLRMPWREKP